ncbi:hypothetical protein [Streptomyces poriticola]|uniref:hypothetical protein n=1 Tax=Streptomyces poriticola TaxID=3120506 RepID=UPI002FCE1867
MTSVHPPEAETGHATFDVLRAEAPATAEALVTELIGETAERLRPACGFRSARILLSRDGTTVVHHVEWAAEQHREAAIGGLPEHSVLGAPARGRAVETALAFGGTPAAGPQGPAAGRAPGVVAVAVRRLAFPGAARAVLGLLEETGAWKRHVPGFIGATSYLGRDGLTFVNCPAWVDENAYHTYVKHPKIADGLERVARLEAEKPQLLLCTVAAHIAAPARAVVPGDSER